MRNRPVRCKKLAMIFFPLRLTLEAKVFTLPSRAEGLVLRKYTKKTSARRRTPFYFHCVKKSLACMPHKKLWPRLPDKAGRRRRVSEGSFIKAAPPVCKPKGGRCSRRRFSYSPMLLRRFAFRGLRAPPWPCRALHYTCTAPSGCTAAACAPRQGSEAKNARMRRTYSPCATA